MNVAHASEPGFLDAEGIEQFAELKRLDPAAEKDRDYALAESLALSGRPDGAIRAARELRALVGSRMLRAILRFKPW